MRVDLDTREILPPGQRGELVYTTLRKHPRPLIRFRTGHRPLPDLKARIGIKPQKVIVLPDGSIERSTHKAKRIIDERRKEE